MKLGRFYFIFFYHLQTTVFLEPNQNCLCAPVFPEHVWHPASENADPVSVADSPPRLEHRLFRGRGFTLLMIMSPSQL